MEVKFRAWDKEKIEVRKGCKGTYKQNGYILAKAPYHPSANKRGYVYLHRLIMENYLGRYLESNELVHHIDGNRENNNVLNLKLTTPSEHHIKEHYERRNPNGQFVANEPIFSEIKYRLYDRDKNLISIYTLQELISKTYRRAKFEFRGRYTGLKDKNGKEIYEGDIVHYKSAIDQYGETLIHEQTGKIETRKGMTGFTGKTKQVFKGETKISDSKFLFLSAEIYEVIGNIYEHSYLLNNGDDND